MSLEKTLENVEAGTRTVQENQASETFASSNKHQNKLNWHGYTLTDHAYTIRGKERVYTAKQIEKICTHYVFLLEKLKNRYFHEAIDEEEEEGYNLDFLNIAVAATLDKYEAENPEACKKILSFREFHKREEDIKFWQKTKKYSKPVN